MKHLGILAKTLLIVCTVVCLLVAAFALTSRHQVSQRFQTLEEEETAVNLERLLNEVDNSLERIAASVADWAPWDETYAFVGKVSDDYVENNLGSDSFRNLQLHIMLFFRADNTLAYAQFHDLETGQHVAADPGVIAALQAHPQLFQHRTVKEIHRGIVRTATAPLLVASGPIVTSTFSGPIRGTLVFGRYLDPKKLAAISAQTRLSFRIVPVDDQPHLFSDPGVRSLTTPRELPFALRLTDARTSQGFAQYNDVSGHPALIFALTQERRLFQQGMTMWQEQVIAMALMGGVFVLALVVLLHRSILRRLTTLTTEVDHVAESGRYHLQVVPTGHDEIAELGQRINTMLASLHTLQELRNQNEQHLQTIIDSINCGILIVDAEDRRIVSVNRTGATLLNRAATDVVGTICHGVVCPRELNHCPVLDEGEAVDLSERSLLLPDGSLLPVLKSVTVLEQGEKRLLLESFFDISELKQAQHALEASETKYRQFFEDSLTGNFITSRDGVILDCNPAYAHIFGYRDAEEVIGVNILDHYPNQGERTAILDRLAEKGRLDRYGVTLRHRNGSMLHLICNLIGEFDDQGTLARIRGFVFDDTKRVQLEEEIRQGQKLEAIGTMAGGIAHDFNNILAGMMGYAEIVLRDLGEAANGKLGQNLHHILTAGERARGLIQKILTFSRQTETQLRPIRLQRVVDDVLELVRVSLPSTIAIEQRTHSEATVLADPIQIHQVLMNLCTNAGHAMRERGGTLTIDLEDVALGADFTGRHPEITAGEYVRIEVTDTGKGIPAHLQERIFDPFFTTKKKGEGTGLGLAMVHGIVSAMHGLIQVASQEGQGTTFTLYLPTIKEEETMTPSEYHAIPTGHEHVVYVDDESFLVDIGTEILRGLGYQVTGFTDSDEALHFVQTHTPEVDLVISDLTMPKLTGLELAQSLQSLETPPPVVICTGHNEGLSKSEAAAMGIRELLLKPVTVNKLAVTVRQVLDAQPA
jgi:PAS domain S-box-containing protein